MSVSFKRYHRGDVPDSRDVPDFDEDERFAFHCPECDFEYVHIVSTRMVEGPYDGRLCAEIALSCENGCETTMIFGNYKGQGYCHWTEGIEWVPADVAAGFRAEDPPEDAIWDLSLEDPEPER